MVLQSRGYRKRLISVVCSILLEIAKFHGCSLLHITAVRERCSKTKSDPGQIKYGKRNRNWHLACDVVTVWWNEKLAMPAPAPAPAPSLTCHFPCPWPMSLPMPTPLPLLLPYPFPCTSPRRLCPCPASASNS